MCVLPLLSGGISSWRQGRGNPLRHTTTHTDTGVSLDSPSSSSSMPVGLCCLLFFCSHQPPFTSQAWPPLICSFSLVHLPPFISCLILISSLTLRQTFKTYTQLRFAEGERSIPTHNKIKLTATLK